MSKTKFLYVLKLQNNKYYVGTTSNLDKRVSDHFNGKGSEFTKKYSPISLVDSVENPDEFVENDFTKKYMKKYGIDNVRGGSYCQIKLDNSTKKVLEKEMNTANNGCFKCGDTSHFAKDCDDDCWVTDEEYSNNVCERCGRTSHHIYDCFASTDIHGKKLSETKYYKESSSNRCYRCGRTSHYANECFASTDINGYYI